MSHPILRSVPSHLLLASLLAGLTATPSAAQTKDLQPIQGTFEQLFPPDAKVEKIAGGFGFVEGPLWIEKDGGYLLFSDIPGNRVHRLRPFPERLRP